MSSVQVEQKTEAIEVPLDIIVVWIPFLKFQPRGELRLSGRLEAGWYGNHPCLRTFRVKIAAKPLEVGAEV
jgi:hypothetical protein